MLDIQLKDLLLKMLVDILLNGMIYQEIIDILQVDILEVMYYNLLLHKVQKDY
jgi:hypothetical protein